MLGRDLRFHYYLCFVVQDRALTYKPEELSSEFDSSV